MNPPRVRFAPAPTGYLHVGGARAALFNWLFARQSGGMLVLRVEDTDEDRSRPELTSAILDSLEWLGIDWDEGPVHQSGRRDLYRAAVEKLLAGGFGYLVDADDNRVDGDLMRDGHGVRIEVPGDGSVVFADVVRGEVTFELENVEDFVVWRSNGTPTFVLANAVDDVDLAITHVIRGEDLLASTPKVILLRRALGHDELPVYAHLPLLVNEQRQKLSKRRDDVAVGEYREGGYLPEAMANYLALLGWGPPDGVEIRPITEIVELFRLEDVTKAAAFFDRKKLDHFNGEYIRALPTDEFVARAEPWLQDGPWDAAAFDQKAFRRLAPVVQERVRTLADVPEMVDWAFLDDPRVDEASWDKVMVRGKAAGEMLDGAARAFADCDWDPETLHGTLAEVGERNGLKLAKAQAPVRVAVTGRRVGPPLFESLAVLGRDETLRRIRAAQGRLAGTG